MGKTTIEWCDRSVNPIRFGRGHYCQKISPGCANCYASRMQPRFQNSTFGGTGSNVPHITDEMRTGGLWLDESKLDEVLRLRKPARIFWCDMTDLFGDWVPTDWISRCFKTMEQTPQHTHQVLTKRPRRMAQFVADQIAGRNEIWLEGDRPWPLPNVWLGVSCEDQQRANERVPQLLRCPAAVRFVSAEPLLGAIDFEMVRDQNRFPGCVYFDVLRGRMVHEDDDCRYTDEPSRLDWVIVGGESGPKSRPCDVNWIRTIVDDCESAKVACFVKQLGRNPIWQERDMDQRCHERFSDPKGGNPDEWPSDLCVRQMPRLAVPA